MCRFNIVHIRFCSVVLLAIVFFIVICSCMYLNFLIVLLTFRCKLSIVLLSFEFFHCDLLLDYFTQWIADLFSSSSVVSTALLFSSIVMYIEFHCAVYFYSVIILLILVVPMHSFHSAPYIIPTMLLLISFLPLYHLSDFFHCIAYFSRPYVVMFNPVHTLYC